MATNIRYPVSQHRSWRRGELLSHIYTGDSEDRSSDRSDSRAAAIVGIGAAEVRLPRIALLHRVVADRGQAEAL